MKFISFSIVAMMLVACGSESAQEEAQKTPEAVEQTDGASEEAALPNVVIARVPLDENGNEMTDEVETKIVKVDEESFSAEQSEDVFEASEDSITVANELDEDTSSDSYRYYNGRRAAYYWNTPWYPGKILGRGYFWGRNPYVSYGRNYYRYNYYGRYNCRRGARQYRYYSYNRW